MIDFFLAALSIDFLWTALVCAVMGFAIGAGVTLAAQWRNADWKEDED